MSVWTWSNPLGLGAFILAIAITLALLSWSIKLLASSAPSTRGNGRRGR
jgi:hypothetical protein